MSELIYSKIAKEKNIQNIPDLKTLDNLLNLIIYCLQPIRNLIKKPMIITSGYRSEKLNDIIGGAKKSQHLLGCAVDFKIKTMKPTNIIEVIKNSNIEFDQLINEYDSWVHISYKKDKNRRQVLYIK